MAAGVVKIVRRNRPSTHLADGIRPWNVIAGGKSAIVGEGLVMSLHTGLVCRDRPDGIIALFGGSCLGIDHITLCKQCCLLLLDIYDEGPKAHELRIDLRHRVLLFSERFELPNQRVGRLRVDGIGMLDGRVDLRDRISLAERSRVRSIGLNGCERRRRRTLQSSCLSGCLVALIDQGRALLVPFPVGLK